MVDTAKVEGRKEKREEVVKKLKEMGLFIVEISKVTGLSADEIEKL